MLGLATWVCMIDYFDMYTKLTGTRCRSMERPGSVPSREMVRTARCSNVYLRHGMFNVAFYLRETLSESRALDT